MAGKKNAWIYLRVSSRKQRKKETPVETQQNVCLDHCAKLGHTVSEVFIETFTGTELKRPVIDAIVQRMQHERPDVLVCYAIDRLSRDPEHLLLLMAEIEGLGVSIEFVTEDFDDSDEGSLLRYIMGFVGKKEHALLRARSNDGKANRRSQNKITVAPRPRYGYEWNEDRTGYIINPETADVVRSIFRWAAQGVSLRQICRRLTSAQISTPMQVRKPPQERLLLAWQINTVTKIVQDRQYIGMYAFLRTRYARVEGRYLGTPVDDVDLDWKQGIVPAVVTVELWEAANQFREVQQQLAVRNRKKHSYPHLLRGGYARCGYCGHAAIGGSGTNGKADPKLRPFYACSPINKDRNHCPSWRIQAHILDDAVWALIQQKLRHPETIAHEIERLRAQQHDPAPELPLVDKQLAEVNADLSTMRSKWARESDERFATILREQIGITEQRVIELTGLRDQLLAHREGWELAQTRLSDFTAWCHAIAETLDEMAVEDEARRWCVQMLGVTVKIYQEHDTEHDRFEISMRLKGLLPDAVYCELLQWSNRTQNDLILTWTYSDLQRT